MTRAKRISKMDYFWGWAKSGFPKRKGKMKSYVVRGK